VLVDDAAAPSVSVSLPLPTMILPGPPNSDRVVTSFRRSPCRAKNVNVNVPLPGILMVVLTKPLPKSSR